jgi:membrane protease YdiL (CAAX protease family)
MKLTIPDIVDRLTMVARGLGFVFLVYFIPVVARDLLGNVLPGGGFVGLLTGDPDGPFVPLLLSTLTVAVSGAFVLLYSRTWEGACRPRRLLRFDRDWWREWGHGTLIGVGAATLVLAPLFLAGIYRLDSVSFGWREQPGWLLAIVAVLFLEGAREEFSFRGPAQRELTGAVSFPIAAIVLAGSFAIIHAGNPNVGRSGVLGVFLAALALAGLARARGDLGMVCGVHAGWNIGTAVVWSVPVSGFQLDVALLDVSSAASDSWTGGAFGVEGSVPGIVAFLALAFVSWSLPPRVAGSGEPTTRPTTSGPGEVPPAV